VVEMSRLPWCLVGGTPLRELCSSLKLGSIQRGFANMLKTPDQRASSFSREEGEEGDEGTRGEEGRGEMKEPAEYLKQRQPGH